MARPLMLLATMLVSGNLVQASIVVNEVAMEDGTGEVCSSDWIEV